MNVLPDMPELMSASTAPVLMRGSIRSGGGSEG